jgi:hypothetical protein
MRVNFNGLQAGFWPAKIPPPLSGAAIVLISGSLRSSHGFSFSASLSDRFVESRDIPI